MFFTTHNFEGTLRCWGPINLKHRPQYCRQLCRAKGRGRLPLAEGNLFRSNIFLFFVRVLVSSW